MTEPKSAIPAKPISSSKRSVSTTTGWNPFDSLRTEIDRLFDDFHPFELAWPGSRPTGRSATGSSLALLPAMDMVERAGEFEITAELPGIDEKNIEIKLLQNAVVIRGEKREEHEEKEKDYHLSERRYGSFQRSFRLPEGTDPEKIEAKFSKGVLTVHIPKLPVAKNPEKKIEIKAV
jgi:HSP20 family protein